MNNLNEKLINCFDSYEDFPQEGILFRDVLPVLKDPQLFDELIESMASTKAITNCEALVGIDARGFLFGTAIAIKTSKPLVLARKPGKLPGDIITNSYSLEYGTNTLCLQKKSIERFASYAIIDDLLATGGTASSVEKMLLEQSKEVTGLLVVVELEALGGSNLLNCEVFSQIKF